jgi:hypothetical protein
MRAVSIFIVDSCPIEVMDLGNIFTRRLISRRFATAINFVKAPTQHAAPRPIRILLGIRSGNPGCAAPGLERATKRPHSKPTAIQKGLAIGGDWSGTAVLPDPAPPALAPRWGFGGAAAGPPLTEWRISVSKSAKKRVSSIW